MLIEDCQLEVFTPPCEPGAPHFAAKAHLKADIRSLLPYLNAILEGAEYNPAAPALRWRRAGHAIVFHPLEILVSNVADRDEAEQEVRELIELVNGIWEQRAEIEPNHAVWRRPSHLAIFKLLPAANCRECGAATCYNFALKLATGQANLSECPRLTEKEYRAALDQLKDLLAPR